MVGAGTHEELLASCGEYRRLWEAQQVLERYSGGSKGPKPVHANESEAGDQTDDAAMEGEVSADDNQD